MELARVSPLDAGHEIRVEAQLEDGGRLGPAGELRVPHLVTEVSESARPITSAQEVGVATPAPVEQHGLVDDLAPLPHGFLRLPRGLCEALEGAVQVGDLDHVQAFSLEGCLEAVF